MELDQRRGVVWGAGVGVAWAFIVLAFIFISALLKARAGIALGEVMAWGISQIIDWSAPLALLVSAVVDWIGGSTDLVGVFYALLFLGIFVNWAMIGALLGWIFSALRHTWAD